MELVNRESSILIQYTPYELGSPVQVEFSQSCPQSFEISSLPKEASALLFFDENLPAATVNAVESSLSNYLSLSQKIAISCEKKDLKAVQEMWVHMTSNHPDVCVAIGGGVLCDMVSFASSCYHRGHIHVLFPTTPLSILDACIGGKTGIDFNQVKNSIGTVHYALKSFCVLDFLSTLSDEEFYSGFSEAIKAASLFDLQYFERLERFVNGSPSLRDSASLLPLIAEGAKHKATLCERPMNVRSLLLYGHNIGHALEVYDSSHRRHGDCVSIGMNIEAAISVVAGLLPLSDWVRQRNLLRGFNLPTNIPTEVDIAKLIKIMKLYKLYRNKKHHFIIPHRIGEIAQTEGKFYFALDDDSLSKLFAEALGLIEAHS